MQKDFHTMDKALIKFTVQCLVWGFLRAEATRESERASNEKVAQDQASEAIFNMVVSFTADECNEEDGVRYCWSLEESDDIQMFWYLVCY